MPGARVVDQGQSSRDGYDMVVASFGPGAAAPLFVTVDDAHAQTVVGLARADKDVVDAQIVAQPAASGRTVVRVTPATPVDSAATSDLVARLRANIGAQVPDALVGGPAAQNHDLTAVLTGRAPLAIGIIMVVAFVLLLVVFRSLTIALSSIALNLISVGASFGFATLVFQHGFGAGLLGIHPQGFVDAWAPLFFFALLFGLSMDYQLFLLGSHPRTLRGHRRHPARHPRRHRPNRATDHQRRLDHDRRVHRLRRHRPHPTHRARRHPGPRRAGRRHRRAHDARPVAHGAPRRPQLVAAQMARPAAPRHPLLALTDPYPSTVDLFSADNPRDTAIAWLFVTVQFTLLGLILLLPAGDAWTTPSRLAAVAQWLEWIGIACCRRRCREPGPLPHPAAQPGPHGELRTGGLYRLVRHPIYSGLIALTVGAAVRSQNLAVVFATAALTGWFSLKARWEEDKLRARYPGYADYASRTPRFVPFWPGRPGTPGRLWP